MLVDEEGRTPMAFEGCASPDFVDAAAVRMHAKEDRAYFVVGGRDQDKVIVNDGIGGIDGFGDAGAEPEAELGRSVGGVYLNETLAEEAEEMALTVKGGGNG